MKSLFEYLVNLNYKLGNIIFELDESSQELLGSNTQHIFEMGKYYDKISKSHNNSGNRLVWTSDDGDGIRMGGHATDRLDRSIEKGGDGEHIEQREIIDMFIWAWKDLINMYNKGYLSIVEYDSNVICCRCYIYEKNNKLFVGENPRPFEKNLWAAFFIKEKPDYKIDVIIKTLFRGVVFKHSTEQDRLVITINGKVKQIIPKKIITHKEHEPTGYDTVLKHTKITDDPVEACYIGFKTSYGDGCNYIPYDSRGYVTKYVVMDEDNNKTRWSFATKIEKDIAYEENIPFIKITVDDAIDAAKMCLQEGIPIFLGHKYGAEFITCEEHDDYDELNLNELNKLWI